MRTRPHEAEVSAVVPQALTAARLPGAKGLSGAPSVRRRDEQRELMLRKPMIGGLIAATLLAPMAVVAAQDAASASPAGPTGPDPAPAVTATAPANPTSPPKRPRPRIVILRSQCRHRFGTVNYSKWYARKYMDLRYGWRSEQYRALESLWYHESNWLHRAGNTSGAYGIPQALPGNKMRSAGADWQTNPETQIRWGLRYIKSVYGSPTSAFSHWRSHNWY